MADEADEKQKQPEVNLSEIIQRIVNDEDNERLKSFTSLLNTFNYAVQIQSGRSNWEPADFKLYAIALSAMDQIGKGQPRVVEAMRPAHNRVAK